MKISQLLGKIYGSVPESGQRGRVVAPPPQCYDGSNPSRPTNISRKSKSNSRKVRHVKCVVFCESGIELPCNCTFCYRPDGRYENKHPTLFFDRVDRVYRDMETHEEVGKDIRVCAECREAIRVEFNKFTRKEKPCSQEKTKCTTRSP